MDCPRRESVQQGYLGCTDRGLCKGLGGLLNYDVTIGLQVPLGGDREFEKSRLAIGYTANRAIDLRVWRRSTSGGRRKARVSRGLRGFMFN
jgi:hypothetical protein